MQKKQATVNLSSLSHKVSDDSFVFLIMRLRFATHEKIQFSSKLICATCAHICRAANFFWLSITPDHLVDLFPNLFLGQSPQEKWHLCTKNYLQQAYLQFFGSLHHPRSPATHSSFQSVRGYTKAWLTADLPSSSPRTSITVFPLTYPHQNPAPEWPIYIQGRWGGSATVFHEQNFYSSPVLYSKRATRLLYRVGLLEGDLSVW